MATPIDVYAFLSTMCMVLVIIFIILFYIYVQVAKEDKKLQACFKLLAKKNESIRNHYASECKDSIHILKKVARKIV